MEIVWAAVGGFLLGLSVWFPYKFILNKLVASKRETSSILLELGMNEKEHAQFQQAEQARNSYRWVNPGSIFTTPTNIGGGGTYTTTSSHIAQLNSTAVYENALATLVGQYGNASTGSGTYASSSTAGTDSPEFPDTSDTHQEDEQQQ